MAVHAVAIPSPMSKAVTQAVATADLELKLYENIDELLQESDAGMLGCILINGGDSLKLDIAVVTQLQAHLFGVPVVLISNSDSTTNIVELMRANVFSVLTLPLDQEQLVKTIRRASQASEQSYLMGDLRQQASARLKLITDKESDVLDLVVSGFKNKEIAKKLDITIRAVEHRRCRLMEKLESKSVAELIATAISARYFDEQLLQSQTMANGPVASRQLVKGLEVWLPSADEGSLSLTQSVYCHAPGFKRASSKMKFKKGEGLPGKVWLSEKPVFMRDLDLDGFIRANPAEEVGITTGVGIPTFENGELKSVILILLDGRHENRVALESWSFDFDSERFRLADGQYVDCDNLRRLSQFVELPLGTGMAGHAAEQHQPNISVRFVDDQVSVRGSAIAFEEFSLGVALPLIGSTETVSDVMVLLNSIKSPMFRLFQIWKPSVSKSSLNGPVSPDILKLASEYFDDASSMASQTSKVVCSHDAIAIKAFETKLPVLSGADFTGNRVPSTRSATPLSFAIAIPFVNEGKVVSVAIMAAD